MLVFMFVAGCSAQPTMPTADFRTSLPVSSPYFQPTATLDAPIQATITFQQDDLERPKEDKVWMNYPTMYALDSKILFCLWRHYGIRRWFTQVYAAEI